MKKFVSFKTKLTRFGLFLVLLVAVPVLVIEVQRPWDSLRKMVDQSETLIAGVVAAITEGELKAMCDFAEAVAVEQHATSDADNAEPFTDDARKQSFGLLLLHGELPPEDAILETYREEELSFEGYDYALLRTEFEAWKERFARQPGLLETFRRVRRVIDTSKALASESGFDVADIYLMYDCATDRSEYFADQIAFVLDGFPWTDTSYPGYPYNLVETDTTDWRTSYDAALGGQTGFHSAALYNSKRWFLPDFDEDEWGTWFSIWFAKEIPAGDKPDYCTINIDVDASSVQSMLLKMAGLVLGSSLGLGLLTVLVARSLSSKMTRPIDALVEGSKAVMAGKTDHVVRIPANDEFTRLIEVFNQLVSWFRERTNLREALSKILSEELADKAAQEGLVLGGQRVQCSILFTDCAGFSSLSRGMEAEEVVGLLNFYFGEMVPIIKRHGGFPDKYVGDGIIAIFGAPVPLRDHANRSLRCAIEIQRHLRQVNDNRRISGLPVFEMRIGINSGDVVAGAIGCDLKLEYTSIGETTNLAQRMETSCDIGQIRISSNTFGLIDQKAFRDVTIVAVDGGDLVKGYDEAVASFAVLVNHITIHKNPAPLGPRDFFTYSPEPTTPPCKG